MNTLCNFFRFEIFAKHFSTGCILFKMEKITTLNTYKGRINNDAFFQNTFIFVYNIFCVTLDIFFSMNITDICDYDKY